MSSRCKACGAAVLFVRSAIFPHPWMILDAEPNPLGRVMIERRGTGFRAIVIKSGEAPLPEIPRYADHHVTCPKSADFRGKR